ncbi:MAG: AAA family ATPase [Rhodocyclaceae bacterium]|nr:AAA family ATPase [Rhodocyclaceae bacterium]
MKIFAITNQKGGVGKTTTSVNLAAGLASLGQRVLLVDLDPQGNATMGSGVDKRNLGHNVYHMLLGLAKIEDVSLKTQTGFDILPANRDLAGAEVELVDMPQRDFRLREALATVADRYDFVLLDCPPALNLLTVNALTAANAVMIPMQCEYYALEGLSDLVATIRRIRQSLNPVLEIEGLLRTMFDPRNTLANQVSAQLEQHFGAKVYATIIPRNVRLAEAPSYGMPAMQYDRSAKGAQAYDALAREVLARAGVTFQETP